MRAHTHYVNNVFYEFLENIVMKVAYFYSKIISKTAELQQFCLLSHNYSGRVDSTIWSVFKNVSVVKQTDVITYYWELSILLNAVLYSEIVISITKGNK